MRHPAPILAGLLAALTLSATTAAALPAFAHKRAEVFAICSGRLSALATRQRARDEDIAQETQRLADVFDMLLDAVLPDVAEDGVSERVTTRWRSTGWGEIAALMAEVDYNFDAGIAERARMRADAQLAACTELVLPVATGS